MTEFWLPDWTRWTWAISHAKDIPISCEAAEQLVDPGIVSHAGKDVPPFQSAGAVYEGRTEHTASIRLKLKQTVRHGVLNRIDLQ